MNWSSQHRFLPWLAVALAALLFALDLLTNLGVAAAALYVVVVWLAYAARSPRGVGIAAVVCSLLTLLDLLSSTRELERQGSAEHLWRILANRSLSLFLIWFTALLCWRVLRLLAAQAQQTAAAVRLADDSVRRGDEESRRSQALTRLMEDLQQQRENLALSEERFRLAIDAALDAIVTMDEQGLITNWNPQAARTFGWSHAEAVGRSLKELIIPPRFRQDHDRGIERFRRTGEGPILNRRIELAALRRSGQEFPIELAILPLKLAVGYQFCAFVRDISQRKQAEAEQQDSLAREQQRKENLAQLVNERTGELAAANEELQRAHNLLAETASRLALPVRDSHLVQRTYPVEEFLLRDMMDCGAAIRGLSNQPTQSHFAAALVSHLYDRLLDREGNRALVLARLFETRRFDELDDVQQRIAREALPAITGETRCLTLVATAGDEEAWNDVRRSQGHQAIPLPSGEAIQRLPMVAQLIRQLGVEVSGVLDPDRAILVAGAETGVFHIEHAPGSLYIPAQEEFVVRHAVQSVVGFGDLLPDGRLFAVILFSRVPIPRETARLLGHLSLSARMALLAHLDVPDRTEAQILSLDRLLRNHEQIVAGQEEHLRQTLLRLAASNAELEQFAYVASHDLQEPLRKVQAFGNLLASGFRAQLGDDGRDYLDRMQRAAVRMQTLINDLLALSRVLRKGQPFVPVNLNDAVRSVLVDLETRLAQTGGRVEAGELPTIDADPTQIQQLLLNLIGNGLKYQRPGTPPVVRIAAAPANGQARNGAAGGWQITVEDQGIGFEPKYAERIFQPFQRLHGRGEYEGTGIGLTICRRIVERHGGTITAEGRPGAGATFVISLPAQQSPGG